MKFWRNQPHVCSECRAYFAPWPDGTREPTGLCGSCRDPIIARADRIAVVLDWARQNWESLEPQATQFAKERAANYQAYMQASFNQQASAGASMGLGDALGNFGIFR